ncbi:MAG: serine hydrolase [Planctomycetales bacterium]|nr:serine hydrolase [Planctomycetales bacterium]
MRIANVQPKFECLETRSLLAGEGVIAESVFDIDQFETNIRDAYVDNTVGFGYSINYEGNIGVRHDGWGDARTATDEPQSSFTEDTRMTIASVAKSITAVATLRLLQDQGRSVDDAIAPYLPTAWTLGPNVAPSGSDTGITFRDLLTHHSGLRRIDFDGSSSDGDGPDWNGDGSDDDGADLDEQTSYSGLQQLIALGITDSTDNDSNGEIDLKEQYSYENANFALLRIIIPYLSTYPNQFLDSDPHPEELTAGVYEVWVQNTVLEPMGIVGAATRTAEEYPTLNYPFPNDDTNPIEYRDLLLVSGSQGWWLSTDELAQFLQNVFYEETVLDADTREMMTKGFLGWNNPKDWGWSEGVFGTYYNHGGDLAQLNSCIMSFPNTAQVSLLINSDFAAGLPYQCVQLKDAYENAWPELVVEGTASNDMFSLMANADDGLIDLFLNGKLVGTRRVSTLEKLTIRGLEGDDTFAIFDLPENVELVVEGGSGDDEFEFKRKDNASLFNHIDGNVIVLGGEGTDRFLLRDSNGFSDFYSIAGIENPGATGDTRIRADAYGSEKSFQYGSMEHVTFYANENDSPSIELRAIDGDTVFTLYAGNDHNTVTVDGIRDHAAVIVYGQGGSDVVSVSGVGENASVTFIGDDQGPGVDELTVADLSNMRGAVVFEGKGCVDRLILDDRHAGSGRELVFSNSFGLSIVSGDGTFGVVSYRNVEQIELQASDHDDQVRVERLARETSLELFGNDGDDNFRIAEETHDLRNIEGHIVVHGGDGKLPPADSQSNLLPIDDDRLLVLDGLNPSTGDYTIDSAFPYHEGNINKCDGKMICGDPGGALFSITFDQIEQTTLHADQGSNRIDVIAMPTANALAVYAESGNDVVSVESSPMSALMQIFAGDDRDTIVVSPSRRNLGYLRGRVLVDGGGNPGDELQVWDNMSANTEPYILSDKQLSRAQSAVIEYSAFTRLTVGLSHLDNDIHVISTSPETSVLILGNEGNDSLSASGLRSSVVFDGQEGSDHSQLFGTGTDDVVLVAGNVMSMRDGTLMTFSETRGFNGGAGEDLMTLQGLEGVDELIHVRPMSLVGQRIQFHEGTVDINGVPSVDFRQTEAVVVIGNRSDNDLLIFDGYTSPTDGDQFDDFFSIKPFASGTPDDPVVVLKNTAGQEYLTLRNYQNVGVPTIQGLHGADLFDVYVNPRRDWRVRQRRLHLDGGPGNIGIGLPLDDVLRIVYADYGKTSWTPTSDTDGAIHMKYNLSAVDLVYEGMEKVELQAGLPQATFVP